MRPGENSELEQQLFAVGIGDDCASEFETHPTQANDHVRAPVFQSETTSLSPDGTPADDRTNGGSVTLAAVATASAAAADANFALERAIAAARNEGYSWRVIATAADIPHQTLHRRTRRSVAVQEGD